MAAPEGYTPLAIVGYTDKGTYNAGTTYNKYNVVLYDGSSYVSIKDGVTGVTPSNDGVNWRTFANGFPSNGVTTDNFQSTLGNYLANNGTTTNSGFALDARYGKTLQDSVDALNRKTSDIVMIKSVNAVAPELNNRVTVNAEVPEGYKFLCWLQAITNGWIGNSNAASQNPTTDFYTSVGTGGNINCPYLVIKI